eukprot:Partr_v1_DN25395_c0_g1_i1_m21475 putative Phospholipase B1
MRCWSNYGYPIWCIFLLVLLSQPIGTSAAFKWWPFGRQNKKCDVETPAFECPRTVPKRASGEQVTAQTLHPSDIAIVASMGDSVTAGLFMRKKFSFRVEDRQYSYGTGSKIDSIASNIQRYQPMEKSGLPGLARKPTRVYSYKGGDGLNFAVSASGVAGLQDQFRQFIHKLTRPRRFIWPFNRIFFPQSNRFDADEKWKLVTVWIGAIDLCHHREADYLERHLMHALLYLQKNMKRIFVNLVLHPDILRIYHATKDLKWCRRVQGVMKMCPELFDDSLNSQLLRTVMNERRLKYNVAFRRVARYFALAEDPMFMVAAQGGIMELEVSKMKGTNFLSKVDCFHPNVCSNRQFAFGLWNSMFSPLEYDDEQSKKGGWKCPSEFDYLQ